MEGVPVRSIRAWLIAFCIAAIGFWLLASVEAPGGLAPAKHMPPGRSSTLAVPSLDSTATLREKLRGIERACSDAEDRIAALEARHRSDAISEATLPTRLAELQKQIERLESRLTSASAVLDEAEKNLADCNASLQAFLRKYEPRTKLEAESAILARKVAHGEPWFPGEASAWAGTPGDIQDIFLCYWRIRDKISAEKRRLVKAVDSANETRDGITKSLAAARNTLKTSRQELADSRKGVEEIPALLTLAKADAARLAEARKQVAAQLVAAETAKRRRDEWLVAKQRAAAKRVEARRSVETERHQRTGHASAAYAFAPNPRGPLSNLPPVVRTLILAEAAGIDTGVHLLPDDDTSPIDFAHDALGPPVAPTVGVEIHTDGMGMTTRQGNQTLVQRADGPSSLYTRQGAWESVQNSNGVVGQRYYDDYRGVIQFDFVNPNTGYRTLGEQPYEGNYFFKGWSQQVPVW